MSAYLLSGLTLARALELLLAVVFGLLAVGGLALTLFILGGLMVFLWSAAPWLLAPLVLAVIVTGVFLGEARAANGWGALRVPHPGPRLPAISPGGPIGFVFVLGYLVMFLGGLPGFRPVVFGLAVLGGLCACGLIARRRHAPLDDGSPLKLK